jgi:uncharacterized DUF497 family protein
MESVSFEWDEKKSKANLTKHKVSFDEAQTVFFDSHARMIFDPDHSSSEDRFILLGMSALLRVLVVCHCCREDDGKVIRIISARKANRKEQKQYESHMP